MAEFLFFKCKTCLNSRISCSNDPARVYTAEFFVQNLPALVAAFRDRISICSNPSPPLPVCMADFFAQNLPAPVAAFRGSIKY